MIPVFCKFCLKQIQKYNFADKESYAKSCTSLFKSDQRRKFFCADTKAQQKTDKIQVQKLNHDHFGSSELKVKFYSNHTIQN